MIISLLVDTRITEMFFTDWLILNSPVLQMSIDGFIHACLPVADSWRARGLGRHAPKTRKNNKAVETKTKIV